MDRCPHCSQSHAGTNHFCPVTGLPVALGPRLLSAKLLDKYTVINILGEGPIGIVLEVEDIVTRIRYAAKLIHPRFTKGPNIAENLIKDIKQVQSVSCDNIAQIVKVGRDSGAAVVVIRELMIGECLSSRIENIGQFAVKPAIEITREILTALHAIHQIGVLNLDLSPSDVFLISGAKGTQVKLVDIGERHVKASLPSDFSEAVGYKYFAPEQLDKSRQPNFRSDIYAAGMILYQMLTGTVPVGDPIPPKDCRKDISDDLSQAVLKAISSVPGQRHQTAQEFIRDLDAVLVETSKSGNTGSVSKIPAVIVRDNSSLNAKPVSDAVETEPVAKATSSEEVVVPKQKNQSETASVIVEMPEIEIPRSPTKTIAVIALLLLLAGVAAWFFVIKDFDTSTSEPSLPEVQITIEVSPSDATVFADGKKVSGSPAVLRLPADNSLHTIAVKADGYESIERDVRLDRSKTVKIELMEIIQPDEPSDSNIAAAPILTEARNLDAEKGTIESDTADIKNVSKEEKAVKAELSNKSSVGTRSASTGKKADTKKTTVSTKPAVDSVVKSKKTSVEKPSNPVAKVPNDEEPPKTKNLEGFRTVNPFE